MSEQQPVASHDVAEANRGGGIFDEDVPSLADLVRFFARQWWVMAGCALAVGLAVFGFFAFVLPDHYEASATLVVVPPRFSSDLKPEALTVQGYQRLLESDAVIGETVRRLIEQGVLHEGQGLTLGEQLSSRIFVSRRSEATSLAPVIEAQGRSRDPDVAATIANTWSEVFLDRLGALISGSVLPSLEFINERYTVQLKEVEGLEQQHVAVADDFDSRYGELMRRWDGKIEDLKALWEGKAVAYRQETEAKTAAYQAQTRTVFQDLVRQQGTTELDQVEAPETTGVHEILQQVITLRTHLAQTSPVVVLEKSISDDALWLSLAANVDEGPLPSGSDFGLRTQESNPLYSELSLRLSEAETRLDSRVGNSEVRLRIASLLSRLEALQRERSSGLSGLRLERAAGLAEIRRRAEMALDDAERQRTREANDLERRRAAALAELNRELEHAKSLFDELASNYNQATLARESQDLEDVRLGSPAVPPLSPVPPRLMLKSLVGFLTGAFLGLLLAVMREVEGWGPQTSGGGEAAG